MEILDGDYNTDATVVYTYNTSITSNVTEVYPTRGGTGGGTILTINGTNFG